MDSKLIFSEIETDFSEMEADNLYSNGTDFWVGVGIGAGIVGAAAALT